MDLKHGFEGWLRGQSLLWKAADFIRVYAITNQTVGNYNNYPICNLEKNI
jgi:hypothetical protein